MVEKKEKKKEASYVPEPEFKRYREVIEKSTPEQRKVLFKKQKELEAKYRGQEARIALSPYSTSLSEDKKRYLERKAELEKQARYSQGRSGKVSRGFSNVFSALSKRGGVTKATYRRSYGQISPGKSSSFQQGNRYGSRGRPKGTFKDIYAQYGGVYGFRKAQALERFKQRQQILNQYAVNPRQRQILAQIQARDQAQMQNQETKTIPDTTGKSFIGNFNQEVDDAANLFD